MADPTSGITSFWEWPVILPAVVGLLSGYQSVYGKFPGNSFDALKKTGSIVYMLTRVMIPLGVYAIWFFSHDQHHSLFFAASLGFGSEIALRSRFYIKDQISADGQSTQMFKGIFEMVEWYQKRLLSWVGTQLADGRNNFVDEITKNRTSFPDTFQLAQKNANAWPEDQRKAINLKLAEINKQFLKDGSTQHVNYIRLLCWAVLDLEGREGVRVLLRVSE